MGPVLPSILFLALFRGFAAEDLPDKLFGADTKGGHDCAELEDECPHDKVKYFLYTKDHTSDPHEFDPSNDDSFQNAPFVKSAPFKLVIHGFNQNKDNGVNELRTAYFSNDKEANYIAIDWSGVAKGGCYDHAARSVTKLGTCVANFIQKVKQHHGDLQPVHVLGDCLGAHVAAWVSKSSTGENALNRVTQFDPPVPMFTGNGNTLYTKATATTVDVWHSNSGLRGATGDDDIDLYLNDEFRQPGCGCNPDDSWCSHALSYRLYAETVDRNTPVKAVQCDGFKAFTDNHCNTPQEGDLRDFGETISSDMKGKAYLTFTNDRSPYIRADSDFTNDGTFKGLRSVHSEDECPQKSTFWSTAGGFVVGILQANYDAGNMQGTAGVVGTALATS